MTKNLNAVTLRVVVYYLIAVVGFQVLLFLFPEARGYLPLGGIDRLNDSLLFNYSGRGIGFEVEESGVQVQILEYRSLTLFITLVATIILTVPLAWVYDATQSIHKHRHDPLIETIYLLPLVVTSVVIIVQNSIALAFSLVGIVAAVRFRNTLKSPTDAVFVFAALAIGLAAGVSEIGIAGVASMAFSLTVLGLRHTKVVSEIRHDDLRAEDQSAGSAMEDPRD